MLIQRSKLNNLEILKALIACLPYYYLEVVLQKFDILNCLVWNLEVTDAPPEILSVCL